MTKKSKKNYIYLAFCFLVWLILFVGLRVPGISKDDYNYIDFFVNKHGEFEFLFTKLTSVIRSFTTDVTLYFLFVSSLSLFILFFSFYKLDKKIILFGLLIYSSHILLYRDYIQLRAAISYNLLFLSVVYALQNKEKKEVVCLILASLFHSTAVVFSFVVFLLKKIDVNIKTKTVVVICSCCFVISFFGVNTDIVQLLIDIMPSSFSISVNTYLSKDSQFGYSLSQFNPTTIKMLVYFYIFSFYRKNIKNIFNSDIPYYLYSISLVIITLFSSYAVFASRFASSFSFVEIFIIPILVYRVSKNNILFLFFIFSILMQLLLNIFYKNFIYQSII
ncbi:TPA: EpsG family protein [Photobacterium damselae]